MFVSVERQRVHQGDSPQIKFCPGMAVSQLVELRHPMSMTIHSNISFK